MLMITSDFHKTAFVDITRISTINDITNVKKLLYKMEVSNFVLDDVMFLESYRYARQEFGYVYLQKFPSDKLYAGQTINFSNRMKQYKKNKGNNDHHTNALKKYDFDNVVIAYQQCPLYLLDTVEIFLIAFFDLTDNKKGYNKTTGGRKGYRVSAETRALLSAGRIGEKNYMYGIKGVNHHRFGKKFKKTPEQIAKTSGENNYMFGKKGKLSPSFGRKKTDEELANMSVRMIGENNPMFGNGHLTSGERNGMFGIKGIDNPTYGDKNGQSKQICAFGKLYGSASVASNTLREVCDTKSKGNFMKDWIRSKPDVAFYVTKGFYEFMSGKDEQITRKMYDDWLSLTVLPQGG
jgi:group I intron endonuclease